MRFHEEDLVIRKEDLISISMENDILEIQAYKGTLEHKEDKYKGKVPKKYIINKNATILIWKDGTKTVVKRRKEDNYNKKLGFLIAYFQKNSGLTKTQANRYLNNLVEMEV